MTWGNVLPLPKPQILIYKAGSLEFEGPQYQALTGVRLAIQKLRLIEKGRNQVGAGLVLNNEKGAW